MITMPIQKQRGRLVSETSSNAAESVRAMIADDLKNAKEMANLLVNSIPSAAI